jgi:uncharacterized protein (DUF1499 family)
MSTSNPLKACPNKPNCISSYSQDRRHSMLPLNFKGDQKESLRHLKKVVLSFPGTELLTEKENYLHFTFKSAFFGFIDDVEFYLDPNVKVIHFRSASRIGYSDLGANRKRMDAIVERFSRI